MLQIFLCCQTNIRQTNILGISTKIICFCGVSAVVAIPFSSVFSIVFGVPDVTDVPDVAGVPYAIGVYAVGVHAIAGRPNSCCDLSCF